MPHHCCWSIITVQNVQNIAEFSESTLSDMLYILQAFYHKHTAVKLHASYYE